MKPFALLLLMLSANSYAADINPVQDRLNRLERDLNILQKQFYRGGASTQNSKSPSGLNVDAANTEARLIMVEEQMRSLNGMIEETQFSIKQLQDKFDILSQDIDYRFNQLMQNKPASLSSENNLHISDEQALSEKPNSSSTPKSLDQQLKDKNNEANKKKEYDEAINLIKKSQFDEAEKKLSAFINKYGEDQYVGYAYYWLGEVYYTRKLYDQSAIQYLKGYKHFPKGRRAPDSLLKLSMALGNMKKFTEACDTLTKLQDRFPNMSDNIKSRANKEYTKLGCPKRQ